MEVWDVYNARGERTGRTVPRGYDFGEGEFFRHMHIIICNERGEYLLQKRSRKLRHYPGKWDVSGGHVMAGEDSGDAAVREAAEELGLQLDRAGLRYIGRQWQANCFTDMWGAKLRFSLEDCVLQPEEVEAVRLASFEEFLDTVRYNKDEEYLQLLRQCDQALNPQK